MLDEEAHFSPWRRRREVIDRIDMNLVLGEVLRALSRLGYRNVSHLWVDGSSVYDHPDRRRDVKTVQRELENLVPPGSQEALVELLRGQGRASAHISLRHPEDSSPVAISFEGKARAEDLRYLVRALSERLPVSRIYVSSVTG